jgi:hypothetical protein
MIEGADQLAASLDALVDSLEHMSEAHRAAARIALEAARARAPMRTGRLRASGSYDATGVSGSVIFTAPYAGPVHWGVPSKNIPPSLFATRGLKASEKQWLGVYEKAIETEVGKVHGA